MFHNNFQFIADFKHGQNLMTVFGLQMSLFHYVIPLRSAASLRGGVRLIVAGLNGGQSRIVALIPRTKTFRLGEFLAWARSLACPRVKRPSELLCASAVGTQQTQFSLFLYSPFHGSCLEFLSQTEKLKLFMVARQKELAFFLKPNMGESLELIGKRLLLLLDDGRSANVSEPEQAARARDWLRGTVRAVSLIGLTAPEVSGGEATTTTTSAGLTVSIYIQAKLRMTYRVTHQHSPIYYFEFPFHYAFIFAHLFIATSAGRHVYRAHQLLHVFASYQSQSDRGKQNSRPRIFRPLLCSLFSCVT